jgi:hypothetical protein
MRSQMNQPIQGRIAPLRDVHPEATVEKRYQLRAGGPSNLPLRTPARTPRPPSLRIGQELSPSQHVSERPLAAERARARLARFAPEVPWANPRWAIREERPEPWRPPHLLPAHQDDLRTEIPPLGPMCGMNATHLAGQVAGAPFKRVSMNMNIAEATSPS